MAKYDKWTGIVCFLKIFTKFPIEYSVKSYETNPKSVGFVWWIIKSECKPCRFRGATASKRWLRCLKIEISDAFLYWQTWQKLEEKKNSLEVAKVIGDWFQHPQIIRALLKTMWLNATKTDPDSVRTDELSLFLYSIVLCWLFYASENGWRINSMNSWTNEWQNNAQLISTAMLGVLG